MPSLTGQVVVFAPPNNGMHRTLAARFIGRNEGCSVLRSPVMPAVGHFKDCDSFSRSLMKSFFLILILMVISPRLLGLSVHGIAENHPQAGRPTKQSYLAREGLYYLETDKGEETALVITRNQKPIPPKPNDPGAPTLPGWYVSGSRFPFAKFQFSPKQVSFTTEQIRGFEYGFTGNFGSSNDEMFGPVPYLVGILTTKKDGVLVSRKRVRLTHAVIA